MPTVVMVNAPDSLLDERRRLGLDRRDEMWDGVMHLVPPAGSQHGRRQARLFAPLLQALEPLGLDGGTEIGVFRPDVGDDYRVPDLTFAPPEVFSDRGAEGAAALVVEARSPNDETWDKLAFYGSVGVAQVLIVDAASRTVHLLVNREGVMVEQQPAGDGSVRLHDVDVVLRFDGDDLVVTVGGTDHRI